ncbi:hypothetical protein [Methylobacterium organophilum]|uniref:hypothetical protein n=1 Tax=Methylobacterium organophilum TaxID=410 RepID=UPI001EE389B3|nr:hypothetical protein [Methylobacterium organophilum]
MGPTRRILEDLEGLAAAGGFQVFEYAVKNRAELVRQLGELKDRAAQGLRPVLHVDAHGTAAEGLLLAPSGDRVGWAEVIELLRELNTATSNNLVSIFALCFGLHLYREVSLMKPAPAYFFGAPPSEISIGFLEAQTLAFYREVSSSSNVTGAFAKTLSHEMQSFHCQGLFFQALLTYIRRHCRAKDRGPRLERMVTAIMKRDGITNPSGAQLKAARQHVRGFLDPGQHLIDKFAPSFLIGRPAAFVFDDLRKVLETTGRKR